MIKYAIVGSRVFRRLDLVSRFVNKYLPDDSIVVSGGAGGVDRAAEQAAKARGLATKIIKAKWDEVGKAAGMIRNPEIVSEADKVVVFWDCQSKGALHSIQQARKQCKPLLIIFEDGSSRREEVEQLPLW